MIGITLKQMRYFEALARHGHFGQAADACAISQPALSMQIKEMEATLGTPLFDRSARTVRLTGLGEDVAERISVILRAVEELGDLARSAQNSLSGRLRLGVIPTIAPYLLPNVLGEVMSRYPAVDLRLRETTTPKLLEELENGRLDTAILALPVAATGLLEMPLFSEDFVLVRPKSDAALPVPGPERLREMRLLLLEEGHCFRDQALSFCELDRTRPREMLEGSSLATLVQMVGAGLGITLIPEMAVGVETRSASVAVARFAAPVPARQIGMVWREGSPLDGPLRDIAALVQQAATRLRNPDGISGDG